MLLENFLISGKSEPSADAKSFIKIAISDNNESSSTSAKEFNDLLSESMKIINNNNVKQLDTALIKSNLSQELQNADADEQGTPGQSIEINSEAPLENTEIVSILANEQIKQSTSGEIMPTDGKQLPGNNPFHNNQITQSPVISESSNLKNEMDLNLESKEATGVKRLLTTNIQVQTADGKVVADPKVDGKVGDVKVGEGKIIDSKVIDAKIIAGNGLDTKGGEAKVVAAKANDGKELYNFIGRAQEQSVAVKVVAKSISNSLQESADKNNQSKFENFQTFQQSKSLLDNKIIENTRINQSSESFTAKLQDHYKLASTEAKSANVETSKIMADQLRQSINRAIINPNPVSGLDRENELKISNKVDDFRTGDNNSKATQQLESKDLDISTILQSDKVQKGLVTKLIATQSAVEQLLPTTTSVETTAKTAGHMVNEPITAQLQQVNSAQSIQRQTEIALSVNVPIQKWNQKFAEHVTMLAFKGVTNAFIRLDPPELGPMAIRIHHQGSETQIIFQVNNSFAKELVDSGTNRLREMLQQQGFDNVNVDVREQKEQHQHASESSIIDQDFEDKLELKTSNPASAADDNTSNSLIDIFA